jgi:hypothetical protein
VASYGGDDGRGHVRCKRFVDSDDESKYTFLRSGAPAFDVMEAQLMASRFHLENGTEIPLSQVHRTLLEVDCTLMFCERILFALVIFSCEATSGVVSSKRAHVYESSSLLCLCCLC